MRSTKPFGSKFREHTLIGVQLVLDRDRLARVLQALEVLFEFLRNALKFRKNFGIFPLVAKRALNAYTPPFLPLVGLNGVVCNTKVRLADVRERTRPQQLTRAP